MKTIFEGKNTKTTYDVETCKTDDGKFTRKPYITKKEETVDWSEIKSFDGEVAYNPVYFDDKTPIYSESKQFRVDLESIIVKLKKVVSNVDINKAESEERLAGLIKEYNKQIIESNKKLSAYCKLHNLNIEDTDVDELGKVVYGDNALIASFSCSPMTYTIDWGNVTAICSDSIK